MASVGCSLFPLLLYSLHAHSPTSAKAQVALLLGEFTLRKGIQCGAVGFCHSREGLQTFSSPAIRERTGVIFTCRL